MAQTDFHFADPSATWNLDERYYMFPSGDIFEFTGTYIIQKDTFFNNKNYQKITGHSSFPAFISRDSTGKVFVYDDYLESERLVYDFSLVQGDTFQSYVTYRLFGPPGGDTTTLVVDSVDIVTYGFPRKRMFMSCSTNNHCFAITCIEGIGSLNSHFLSPLQYEFEPEGSSYSISCFTEQGVTYHFSSSCFVDVPEISSVQFKIYPNPANNYLNADGVQQQTTFRLYDLFGREVLMTQLEIGKNQIEIKNLTNGIYIYKVIGESKVGKVFIEK